MKSINRRGFIKSTVAAGGITLVDPSLLASPDQQETKTNYTILFQGDSITDGNRTRNNDWNHIMGHGYAYLIASRLWYQFPDIKFQIYNRGVSGNTVNDLQSRWDEDTIALKPDLLSILVGINEVYKMIGGDQSFTDGLYDTTYRELLTKTKAQFPSVQLVLCEPFILPVGQVNEKLDLYSSEIKKRQTILRKIAVDFKAIYVPLQDLFTASLKRAPAVYWIWDGIHPMPAGHEMIALEWLKRVQGKLGVQVKM